VLVNRAALGRSVRAGVRRWLPFVTNAPVPRRPLLVATALTAAAAIATSGSTTTQAATQPDRLVTTPAAAAEPADTATAGPAAPNSAGAGSAADRAAKVAAAREKASRAKADRARALGAGSDGPWAKGPSWATADKARTAPGQQKKAPPERARTAPGQQKKAPSDGELMPGGIPGGQSVFAPSREQVRNAEQIVRTGERLKMPPRAQVIAVATALQESKLQNLGHLGAANDHDSLGLFQQRPSVGWGTPEQVTDPDYAAEQFYRGLARVPGYQGMPLAAAAQTVQVSAFPDAYAQWETMAADLVRAADGTGPYADIDNTSN
jgi:hypothetical protein